jgi:predicted nucleotidyltransferase
MMTAFKQNYRKMQVKRLNALETKRKKIVNLLPSIVSDLKQQRISSILVHGSILRPGKFHERSDLDMVIFGARVDQWCALCKIVDDYLAPYDIYPDVRLSQDLPVTFIDHIKTLGMPYIELG